MTSRQPVGVVIPAFDAWPSVCAAIESVLSQDVATKPVVVDDGSKEPLEPLMKPQYPMVTVITQENQGQGAARNAGIAVLDTELVGLLDSDDVWRPGFLKTQMETLTRFVGAAGVLASSNRSAVASSAEIPRCPRIRELSFDHLLRTMQGGRSCSGWLFRRDAITAVGGFDERFRRMQDKELLIRLMGLGYMVLRDEAVLYDYNPSRERGGRYVQADLDSLELFSEKYGPDGLAWVRDRIGVDGQRAVARAMLSRASNVALANGLEEQGRGFANRALDFAETGGVVERTKLEMNRRFPSGVSTIMRLLTARRKRYPSRGPSQ